MGKRTSEGGARREKKDTSHARTLEPCVQCTVKCFFSPVHFFFFFSPRDGIYFPTAFLPTKTPKFSHRPRSGKKFIKTFRNYKCATRPLWGIHSNVIPADHACWLQVLSESFYDHKLRDSTVRMGNKRRIESKWLMIRKPSTNQSAVYLNRKHIRRNRLWYSDRFEKSIKHDLPFNCHGIVHEGR